MRAEIRSDIIDALEAKVKAKQAILNAAVKMGFKTETIERMRAEIEGIKAKALQDFVEQLTNGGAAPGGVVIKTANEVTAEIATKLTHIREKMMLSETIALATLRSKGRVNTNDYIETVKLLESMLSKMGGVETRAQARAGGISKVEEQVFGGESKYRVQVEEQLAEAKMELNFLGKKGVLSTQTQGLFGWMSSQFKSLTGTILEEVKENLVNYKRDMAAQKADKQNMLTDMTNQDSTGQPSVAAQKVTTAQDEVTSAATDVAINEAEKEVAGTQSNVDKLESRKTDIELALIDPWLNPADKAVLDTELQQTVAALTKAKQTLQTAQAKLNDIMTKGLYADEVEKVSGDCESKLTKLKTERDAKKQTLSEKAQKMKQIQLSNYRIFSVIN